MLTPSQHEAMRALLGGNENIFLTGGPGTGKSFLIQEYLKREVGKVPVIASTGAAAILVGGRTFHSFFGLGIMQGGAEAVFERALENGRLKKRLKELKTLVMDEISMLSQEAFDTAEKITRVIRNSSAPWGGVRVIAVGDFAQLPPISRGNRKEWCFLSEAWARSRFETWELKEYKRTEDRRFLEILEEIRWGLVSETVSAFLNERLVEESILDVNVPHLFARRAQTDKFNRARLSEIDNPLRVYKTEYGGDDRYVAKLMKDAPIPPELELKESALVMLRMNDPKKRFVNGSVGIVQHMDDECLEITINGRRIEVEPFVFSLLDADGEEVAYARNFPVTLAYASTIHKIQGTTLERAHIDLSDLWEPGQAYVALSRTRTAEGITLLGWDKKSIIADPEVHAFYGKEVSLADEEI